MFQMNLIYGKGSDGLSMSNVDSSGTKYLTFEVQ